MTKTLVFGCATALLIAGSAVSALPRVQAGEVLVAGNHSNKGNDKKHKNNNSKENNGVRDHGKGYGKNGAGQGKGKGNGPKNKK